MNYLGQIRPYTAVKGLWYFNGNSNDETANGNNGSDTNITYSRANGKFEQGAGFNGSSSKIEIGDVTSLRVTGALTILGWYKPNDPTAVLSTNMIIKGDNAGNNTFDYIMLMQNRKPQFFVSNGVSASNQIGATTPSDGVYHMYAGVYVPSTSIKIYLDGEPDGVNTTSIIASIASSSKTVGIGRNGTATSFFAGSQGMMAVIAEALSADFIKKFYAHTRGKYLVN